MASGERQMKGSGLGFEIGRGLRTQAAQGRPKGRRYKGRDTGLKPSTQG